MDENGLELSLGLSFGGSSGKQKGKVGSSVLGAEEDDRGNKSASDFLGFLDSGKNELDFTAAAHDDAVKPQENFFSNLLKANALTDEEVGIEGSNKRKMLFDEISHQKKIPTQDKSRTSHISIDTDEGSVADNVDVTESEADVSTSKLASHHNMKDIRDYYKVGNLTYGAPFSVQQMNVGSGSQPVSLRNSSFHNAPGTPIHPPSVMRHPFSGAENEQPGIKAMTLGNAPVILGYSPVQLPMMDKDNSWLLAPHAACTSKVPPSSAPTLTNPDSSSEAAQYGRSGRMAEIGRGDGKQHASEEGSLNPAEEDGKAVTDNLFAKFAAIKPGMATDFKFGGCGSFPNLPWVSTTGPGPNGKTISGVTYQFSTNQIRIVCACHGSHLSPEEFVRHASEEKADPENSTTALSAVLNNNPAASAQI